MKELFEKREAAVKKLNDILEAAKKETRAMSEEEKKEFDALEKEIRALDATIEAENRARELPDPPKASEPGKKDDKSEEEAEERAFLAFIRNNSGELRAGDTPMTQGNNGGIVPTRIANRIIKEVRDMVPYLTICDVINTNGKLSVPVYGEDAENRVNADYVDEGQDLTDNIGKFTTIDLNGYVIGALALVSNKLINNTDVDLVSFVVTRVAEAMAEKLEEEFTTGTTKIKGVGSTTKVVIAASAMAITYDELVKVKHSLKQRFRKGAKWIMHPDTYTALCTLKDDNGRPYFKEEEYKILNCDVYESDSMPVIAPGVNAIIFANPKGYTIKATKTVEIKVLREKFSTKNMLGILAFGEYDANITDKKKIAALQMKGE